MTPEEKKEYMKIWRKANKEKIKQYNKEYRDANHEEILEKEKEKRFLNKETINKKHLLYFQNNNLAKEKKLIRGRKYAKENREKINENRKKRKENDIIYKITCIVRTSINNTFKRKKIPKNSRTLDILGCSYEEFICYIESKFEPWMNWENRGKYNGELNYGWDIDHIIPLSTAITAEDVVKLNHYTNLQPLCSKVNRDIKRGI